MIPALAGITDKNLHYRVILNRWTGDSLLPEFVRDINNTAALVVIQ